MSKLKKLLFIDANIWLDFYRGRNDAALALVEHVEAVADQVIVTHQLEQEFKKNRQAAILEGMQELRRRPDCATGNFFRRQGQQGFEQEPEGSRKSRRP